MAESYVQVPPDSTGKQMRTQTGGPNSAHAAVQVLSDATGNLVTTTAIGTRQALDLNIAGSAGGVPTVTQAITTSTVPGTPNTASTTSAAVVAVGAAGNCTVILQGGSYTGTYTFVFEASSDGGYNWQQVLCAREDGALSATGDQITGSAGAGPMHQWTTALPGMTHFRARATAVPGTITTGISAIILAGPFLAEPTPVALAVPMDGNKASYSALLNSTIVANALSASDVWCLQNPATSARAYRITRLYAVFTIATAAALNFQLMKRTTLNTLGTAVAQTAYPYDSIDPASAAVVNLYTAAPTLGIAGPVYRYERTFAPSSTIAATPPGWEWYWGNRPSKAIIIRPGQQLSLFLPVAPATAPTVTGEVEWTEEAM